MLMTSRKKKKFLFNSLCDCCSNQIGCCFSSLSLFFSFRLIIECMSMAPEETAAAAQRLTVTDSTAYPSDEKRRTNPTRNRHRRPQRFFTTQRLPAFFAWLILLTTSFAYWICILPEILVLLPHLLPIPITHCVLFVLVCANFFLATFMDPVSFCCWFFVSCIEIFVFVREFMHNQGRVNQSMLHLILVLLKILMMRMMMILNLVLFVFETVDFHLVLPLKKNKINIFVLFF